MGTPDENEKFFKENGYWPTKFVPRKQILRQTVVDRSDDPESQCGPVVSSLTARSFHHPDCRWAKRIHRLDKIIYASRHEAIKAGKLPCKHGCKA